MVSQMICFILTSVETLVNLSHSLIRKGFTTMLLFKILCHSRPLFIFSSFRYFYTVDKKQNSLMTGFEPRVTSVRRSHNHCPQYNASLVGHHSSVDSCETSICILQQLMQIKLRSQAKSQSITYAVNQL